MTTPTANPQIDQPTQSIADGVDAEIFTANQRKPLGVSAKIAVIACIAYTAFHIGTMNGLHNQLSDLLGVGYVDLTEPWTYRLIHVGGGLALGFMLYSSTLFSDETPSMADPRRVFAVLPGAALVSLAFGQIMLFWMTGQEVGQGASVDAYALTFGLPLVAGTVWLIVLGWFWPDRRRGVYDLADLFLALAAVTVSLYLIYHAPLLRLRAGTGLAKSSDMYAALAGTILILEMARRLAGLALVIIASVFVLYAFIGPWLPGILQHRGYSMTRFFSYVYTDQGILGPTTAISSTYIILFVTFAAFLQASRVGEYFVNFAFAIAGGARGGPAKVAVFSSGLMGMINGTSAGNVVATGSLTIPLMKKVGYKAQTAASIEAAASSGGQILPPIMGAGAFIMAEITGIPYQDIAIAAIIPAALYFISVYFMVDLEAAKLGMRGMREDELPKFRKLVRKVFLFLPIIILIAALFMGYSVIRAGTLATVAAVVVSWATPEHFSLRRGGKWTLQRLLVLAIAILSIALALFYLLSPAAAPGEPPTAMISTLSLVIALLVVATFAYVSVHELTGANAQGLGIKGMVRALEIAGIMSIQIIAVCACAGIIVGVISLTGVGARFSLVLLDLAGVSQLLALFFAMCIAILLGMGMPTTAAYAVAASVVAPGLVQLGIPMLTAHFFVFYFAVVSAITPPVALASYAAAGISGANPMETSVASFKIGLAAFIVPFMFFYNSALLMDGTWLEIIRSGTTAVVGVFLLSSGVQGWFMGGRSAWFMRVGLVAAALFMIEGGILTDLFGIGMAVGIYFIQKIFAPAPNITIPVRGAD